MKKTYIPEGCDQQGRLSQGFIPTEPGELQETKHEVEGVGTLFLYALGVVCFVAVVVMAL